MNHVAHQRYAELTDEDVYLDTLQFNAKAHYALLPGLKGAVYLTSIPDARLAKLINAEVSTAGTGERIELQRASPASFVRNVSATAFRSGPADSFDVMRSIVGTALAAQTEVPGVARMPYPSGGSLYPVLAFVCRTSQLSHGWPGTDSAYQVMPFSRELESLNVTAAPKLLLDVLSGGSADTLGTPGFGILYAMYLDKALFKYRYRGYRLALMETGSMYQRVSEEVQAQGLKTRVWAGFSDYRAAASLGLDATHVLPLVAQFVGS